VKAWRQSIERWIKRRVTLQWRLALWSAVLLSLVSLALIVFVNIVARATIPRAIAIPLLSTSPPPRSDGAGHLTPVPFDAPALEPDTVVKGIAVEQVQQATLRQMLLISVIGLMLAVGLGSVGTYWLAGQALRPVQNLAEVARRIGVRELNERIALECPQDEIKVLADAFDDMLARLERAFEQQDRFVGDAAHELRTPLATLRTNLEVIQADPDATLSDYREMTFALERALTRLERLVAGLLLLASAEKQMAPEEVSLGPLLEEVLLELKPLADERQVSLHLDGEIGMGVRGDGRLLASAFGNLVENGIRYNHPGGKVTVSPCREGDWAMIAVADTGIGISEEEQAHIFDRFYRADRSRSRHRGGAGLGLSIVAHVIQQHGGQVEVESTPGVGSTFTVRLPL
jgi:signal transduction histidine kinase